VVDGLLDNVTRRALNRFQLAEGRPQTTDLTTAEFDALVDKAFGGSLD